METVTRNCDNCAVVYETRAVGEDESGMLVLQHALDDGAQHTHRTRLCPECWERFWNLVALLAQQWGTDRDGVLGVLFGNRKTSYMPIALEETERPS